MSSEIIYLCKHTCYALVPRRWHHQSLRTYLPVIFLTASAVLYELFHVVSHFQQFNWNFQKISFRIISFSVFTLLVKLDMLQGYYISIMQYKMFFMNSFTHSLCQCSFPYHLSRRTSWKSHTQTTACALREYTSVESKSSHIVDITNIRAFGIH